MNHLDALELNLSNERARLAAATSPKEIAMRKVYLAQLEREVAGELAFLGKTAPALEMSADELFRELSA